MNAAALEERDSKGTSVEDGLGVEASVVDSSVLKSRYRRHLIKCLWSQAIESTYVVSCPTAYATRERAKSPSDNFISVFWE